jgi:hypothetical protein
MHSGIVGYGALAIVSAGALLAIHLLYTPEQLTRSLDEVPQEASVASAIHLLLPISEAADAEVCRYTSAAHGGMIEGVVYTVGEHVRAEYAVVQQGGAMTSYMVTDGAVVYAWGQTPMGMVGTTYRVDVLTEHLETEELEAQYAQDASDFGLMEGQDYECEPWEVDAGIFTIPDDVSFMDMTDMMKGWIDAEQSPSAGASTAEETPVDCGMCDSLPAELGEQEQCRALLGCNE